MGSKLSDQLRGRADDGFEVDEAVEQRAAGLIRRHRADLGLNEAEHVGAHAQLQRVAWNDDDPVLGVGVGVGLDAGGQSESQALAATPDLDDIAKVALHSDALDTVKSDGMALLFESLAATGVLEPDDALLTEMRVRIDEEVWVCKGELGCRKKRQWQADQSYCQPILQFNVTFRAYTGSGPQQQELQKS
ncbi:hypothetical protein OsI_29681 [Oryza sativa Indica Group]|uniref:Uncharacterized protein n=1 Tax=Oryza sativa subsp. indica TaxID=39946 RepID=B8BC49_ORYSI|nr:hypothetical protein OsI_29681 [Oryza sativa Indica Group]